MDLVLAETFLAVVSGGSLVKAAQRLHITQAAVSARLQSLEELLQHPLFIRNKAGARLTPAGRAFLPHAMQLMQVWEQARRNVSSSERPRVLMTMGGEVSLANALLLDWLVALRESRPHVQLRTHVDGVERLLDQVQAGTLDMAALYSPHRRPGVELSLILEEELVAVSTSCGRTALLQEDYTYVDWGPDFRAQHDQAFPELSHASTSIALGPLALHFLLRTGGTGYFRTRAVEPHLKSGRLHLVRGAPAFSYSVYAACCRRSDQELLSWALAELRKVASGPSLGWA